MKLDIKWEKVLLVWNRGHKNMWDEIILIWNIKLLLQENKKIYVACSNKYWLKNFHKQLLGILEIKRDLGEKKKYETISEWQTLSISGSKNIKLKVNEKWFYNTKTWEQVITYLTEWPKWIRSTFRFLKDISNLKQYFQVNSILIWWWEIFTEETPWSYWYWFFSVWVLLPFTKLYLSGWIQIPKKIWNKIPFFIMWKKAKKIFPDTSIFTTLWQNKIDLKKYKWNIKNEKEKIIIININKRAEKFYNEIHKITDKYYRDNYTIYFSWICKSPKDSDIKYYHKLKKDFKNLELLDWEDWWNFINILSKAEAVYTTRLHLFLISYYLDLKVISFAYQKKVDKMKKVFGDI